MTPASPPPGNSLWGPDWPEVRSLWPLDRRIAHLNHGSFGAVPTPVLEAQDRWRRATEADPTGFFWRTLPDALEEARLAAAAFIRADPGGLAFVTNATTAVNTVLTSLDLGEDDEILVTDHGYGACRLAAERVGERTGATVVVHPVPLPRGGPDELPGHVLGGVTERTRIALIDHVASPTAVVFPMVPLVRELRERGVLSMVDGAHAVGMLDLDVAALDSDFWTGNFHKWCCAPRGAAGLAVREEHRDRIRPVVASWHDREGFLPAFGWTGTADYSPYLTVPDALAFMEGLGWDRVRRHNRALAAHGAAVLGEALATLTVQEGGGGSFDAMTLVALPDGVLAGEDDARGLARRVAEDLATEIAPVWWGHRGWIRLSAQAYNSPPEYERLAEELPALIAARR